MARLLAALGWTGGPGWTEAGRQARAFALNFGGVATYLPLLARLPELYRGELTAGPPAQGGSSEWHVHRALNLRISALAHRRYFVDADAIFLELFDREPVTAQPRFIADMGCGEGSWLVHLHELIREHTRRGRRPEGDHLLMVGIDPDAGAREAARRNLEAAGAEALLLPGDVTDPEGLRNALAEHGLAIEDGLHIRAFIDHERTYRGGDAGIPAQGWASGAYLGSRGAPLAGEAVERDLVAHLRRWAPAVSKHGMVVLEAHCVAPGIASRQLGALHGVAFDAHQAYSQQYPVDHPAFVRCCHEAGLQRLSHCERRYPGSRPFVSISLSRLLAAGEDSPFPATDNGEARRDTWQPDPGADLEDGQALHGILFEQGDVRRLASWCSAPTGFVVATTLAAIEAKLETLREGDSIRVLDYGAGTGTATIELLKACRERRLEERLRDRGGRFELHLVDLPSSWFAQGHALLRACAWTHFHSLRDLDGGFRPLREVTGGEQMDAVMASMVFHLIPPPALGRLGAELAGVLGPGGPLAWSAPDLGPAGPWSVLLHDPNRALREYWLELLRGEREAPSAALREAVRRAGAALDPEALRDAQARADRRIRPRPLATEVTAALAPSFAGEIELGAYEMRSEEIVRGLLVPSNQAEYLPEIPERELREQVIRELMLEEVIPAMREGPGGTALGLNLHWTLGAFSRRP
jgi:SAM-dependent methyltransferase